MTAFEQGYNLFMKLAYHGDPSDEPVPAERKSKQYTREDVAYMDSSPHPGANCAKCSHYQPDGACAIVMGSINPNGICDRYSPKA